MAEAEELSPIDAIAASLQGNVPSRPDMRGGTPPVRLGKNRFLAVMHTVVRQRGRSMYAASAYIFSNALGVDQILAYVIFITGTFAASACP